MRIDRGLGNIKIKGHEIVVKLSSEEMDQGAPFARQYLMDCLRDRIEENCSNSEIGSIKFAEIHQIGGRASISANPARGSGIEIDYVTFKVIFDDGSFQDLPPDGSKNLTYVNF